MKNINEIKGQDFELNGNHVWIGDYHRSEEVRFNASDIFPDIQKAQKSEILSILDIARQLNPEAGTPEELARLLMGNNIPAAITWRPGKDGAAGDIGKIIR